MIYSVRGKITVKELNLAVIECAGVGYACRTTYTTISKIGEIGSECLLYTYLYIREDMAELFGFSTQQELNCFKMLISVSGVGPKAALAILSDVTPEKFAMLVASGDSKLFTKTKCIGAKSAQRIVLELKDKIAKDIEELRFYVGVEADIAKEKKENKNETGYMAFCWKPVYPVLFLG